MSAASAAAALIEVKTEPGVLARICGVKPRILSAEEVAQKLYRLKRYYHRFYTSEIPKAFLKEKDFLAHEAAFTIICDRAEKSFQNDKPYKVKHHDTDALETLGRLATCYPSQDPFGYRLRAQDKLIEFAGRNAAGNDFWGVANAMSALPPLFLTMDEARRTQVVDLLQHRLRTDPPWPHTLHVLANILHSHRDKVDQDAMAQFIAGQIAAQTDGMFRAQGLYAFLPLVADIAGIIHYDGPRGKLFAESFEVYAGKGMQKPTRSQDLIARLDRDFPPYHAYNDTDWDGFVRARYYRSHFTRVLTPG
ncbi:MAG: hypothetical protein HY053_03840 [Proteobacteria bacterium]|nr:hypothetical protein [Pseudomonadota bacterium]